MELLERQTQLDELDRCAREAASGSGKLAFVSGEAGAGKSVLIEEFLAQAPRTFKVYWGHCDALETSRVLGAVVDIYSAMGLGAASLPPREQLFAKLLERLSPPNIATILVLEDLHWADEATLDFVRYLGRRIQHTKCLLIVSYRDDELAPTHPLRRVLGGCPPQHTTRLNVPSLSLEAVRRIHADARHDAQRIYRITGGNPFFVRECLLSPPDEVPETVKDAVLARFVQLSCAARELAEVVSLVPGRAEISLTRAVVCDGGGTGEDIDEAIARGLLKHQDGALSFRHELARLAVEQSVPSARAERWHRAILDVLTAREVDLSRRVHHAVQGREVAAVLDYAPRAAEQAAAAGAHREAAAHWATALRFADGLQSGVRARFLEEHANESAMINATEAAIASAAAALQLWQELNEVEAQGRMQILLAYTYWKAGDNVQADRYVHEAITLLEQHGPSRVLAMAYSVRSQRAMTGGHVTEALGYGQRAINLAVTFDDAATRSHALNNIGATLLVCGDESGIHHLEQSLAIALHKGLHEHAGRAYANLVSVAVGQRMSVLARRYFSVASEYCDRHEVQDCLTYVLAWGAQMELNDGHWSEAAKIASEVLECQTPAVAQRIPALQALGLLRARRGDPGADALLEEAMALSLPTGEFQRIGPLACALAELAFYRGDFARVRAEAERGLEVGQHRQDAWILGELAFWAKVGGSDAPLPADIAEPYRCLLAGEHREAAERWEDLNSPYERALALSYGGKQDLLLALSILEQLGNGPLTAIVRQKLRNLGVRGIPRGQRASTRKNPAGLTTREVQVLSLLVHGHTNAELAQRMHVAPKTVEHHVSSILEKLAVESRTEAVAAAFGLGIVKPEAKGRLQ